MIFDDKEENKGEQKRKVRFRQLVKAPKLRYSKERKLEDIDQLWNSSKEMGFSENELRNEQMKDEMIRDIILYMGEGQLPPTARRQ